MMLFRLHNHIHCPNPLRIKKVTSFIHIDTVLNNSLSEAQLDPQSSDWCERAFPKLIKLTHLLKGLDLISGRLISVNDKHVLNDEFLMQCMHDFKSISTAFIGYHCLQDAVSTTGIITPSLCANKPIYKELFVMNSLKKVCDILVVSAQQRKLVRLAVCPQVTQYQIWTGALMEILNQLKYEMSVKDYAGSTKGDNMAQQIVVNCLRFLDDVESYDPDATSWMRIAPKKGAELPPSAKWADLLEMFDDLITCLKNDHKFHFYLIKLEIMKEGLAQIKDVLVDKNIGYKDARHQQSLVQKKLTKSLGHSSRCLFTLLSYYLYGTIQDIEVDICCWFSEDIGGNKFYLCVGKILTSDGDKMIRRAVKQLYRAIGVIKFVYEIAEMKEVLELQGHIWCIGSESRSIAYRGHKFFIHEISL